MQLPNLIKDHLPATIGIVLAGGVGLWLYIRGKSTGSSGASALPSVVYSSDPATTAASQQLAGIQYQTDAQLTLGLSQIQAALEASKSQDHLNEVYLQTQLAGLLDTNTAQVDIARMQTASSVEMNQSNNDAAVAIAGINADVSLHQTDAAVSIAEMQTNADVAKSNNAVVIAQKQADAAVEVSQNEADAAVAINTANSLAAVTINEQNTDALKQYINRTAEVELAAIDLEHDAVDQKAYLTNEIIKGLNAGVYNKGGEGGANQVSIIAAFFNQPSIAFAAQEGQAAVSMTGPNGAFSAGSGLWSTVSSIFKPSPAKTS